MVGNERTKERVATDRGHFITSDVSDWEGDGRPPLFAIRRFGIGGAREGECADKDVERATHRV
jgi:hypothetical protein